MIELLDGLYSGLAEPDNSGGGSANKKKYGITIDSLLGNVNDSGALQVPAVDGQVNIAGVKSIGARALMNRFSHTAISSFVAPDLESTNTNSCCESAFYNAMVSTFSMPKLKTIGGSRAMYSMFCGCPLTEATITATKISGGYSCQRLFDQCTSLTTVSFTSLSDVGTVTTQFSEMLRGCTNVTVHFPAAIESTIQDWADVVAGFGGTNTTVLFDL